MWSKRFLPMILMAWWTAGHTAHADKKADLGDPKDYHLTDSYHVIETHDTDGLKWDCSASERHYVNDSTGDRAVTFEWHAVPDNPCSREYSLPEFHEYSIDHFPADRDAPDKPDHADKPDAPSAPDVPDSRDSSSSYSSRDSGSSGSGWSSRGDSNFSGKTAADVLQDRESYSSAQLSSSSSRESSENSSKPVDPREKMLNPKDLGDERLGDHGIKPDNIQHIPDAPYDGYGSIAALQQVTSNNFFKDYYANKFPIFIDAYKECKTFAQFQARIEAEAEKIRRDPSYLRDSIEGFGVQRKYWLFGGLIGSHKDYSLAQKFILDLERDLKKAVINRAKNLAQQEEYRLQAIQSRAEGLEVLRQQAPVLLNQGDYVVQTRSASIGQTTAAEFQGDKNLRNPDYLNYLIGQYSQRIAMLNARAGKTDKKAAEHLQMIVNDLQRATHDPDRIAETTSGQMSSSWQKDFPQLEEMITHWKGNAAEWRISQHLSWLLNSCVSYRSVVELNNQTVFAHIGNLAMQQKDPAMALALAESGICLGQMLNCIFKDQWRMGKRDTKQWIQHIAARAMHKDNDFMPECIDWINLAKETMAEAFLQAFANHPNQDWIWDRLVDIHEGRYTNPVNVVEAGLLVFQPELPEQFLGTIATYGQFAEAVQMVANSDAEHKLENEIALALSYPTTQVIEHCAEVVIKKYKTLHPDWPGGDDVLQEEIGATTQYRGLGSSPAHPDGGATAPNGGKVMSGGQDNFNNGPPDQDPEYEQTFDDSWYLNHLATTYRNRSTNECVLDAYTKSHALIIAERAEQLVLAAQSHDALVDKQYEIDNNLAQNYAWLADLRAVRANAARVRLYDEVHNNVLGVEMLLRTCWNAECVQNSTPVIMQLNEAALNQDDPDIAFNLAETAHHLVNIAKRLAVGAPCLSKALKYGLAAGCERYAHHVIDSLNAPESTVIDDLVAPFELAKTAFAAAFVGAFGSHDEREELWQQIKCIENHAYEQPEDVAATGMQFFMPIPTFLSVHAGINVAVPNTVAAAIKNIDGATASKKSIAIQAVQPMATLVQAGAVAVQKVYGHDSHGDSDPHEPDQARTFFDRGYLQHLATRCEDRSRIDGGIADEYTRSYAWIIGERAVQLARAAQNPDELVDRKYEIDNDLARKYSWLENLRKVRANVAQVRVFDEVHGNVRSTLSLKRDLGFDPVVQGSLPTIMQMNELALQQDDPDVAFNLVETGYHLISIAKILASKMEAVAGKVVEFVGNLPDEDDDPYHLNEQAAEAIEPTAKAVVQGLGKGCELYANHLVDLFADPGNTIASDLAAPFKLAQSAFNTACVVFAGNQEDRVKLRQKLEDIGNHLCKQPEDIFTAWTQLFTPVPTFVAIGAVVKATKLTRIAAAVKNNKKAPQLAVQVTPPLPQLVATGTAVAQKGCGGLGRRAIDGLAQKIKPVIDGMLKKHLFKGELALVTKKPTGYHLESPKGPRLIKNLTLDADPLGVYAGYYPRAGYNKFSTFFPKHWSKKKTLEKISEALHNPVKINGDNVIGKTTEGILIELVFHENNKGKLTLQTAYPLYKGEEDITKTLALLNQTKTVFRK